MTDQYVAAISKHPFNAGAWTARRRIALGGDAAVGLVAACLDRADALGSADPPQGARRPPALRDALSGGLCFLDGALHWLRLPHWATSIGWVALSLYFAAYLPAFVALARVAVHRMHVPVVLAAPVVWTGLELARSHLLTGMSMGSLGYTQYRWIELIQLSDLTGAYGVSFVVMFVAASVAMMIPFRLWPVLPAVLVVGGALLYGHARIAENTTFPGPRIALIQGSIDTEMRYNPGMKDRIYKQYYNLSKEALAKHPRVDLVVWPETMFLEPLVTFDADARRPPEFEGSEAQFQEQLRSVAKREKEKKSALAWTAQSLGVPLLLGVDATHFAADGVRLTNSAVYVAPDGRLLGRYDKMHLVMFGEYVPFANTFPWLQRLTPLPVSVQPGNRPAAFELDGVRISPNICYESVLSHVIRGQINRLAAEGREPDVLVNLTNDGWFWGSSELDMHLVCGVFRAVECRKPFLIAANTGFSAWIDSDGRIVQQGPRRATGVILAETQLDQNRPSWYLAHGDWFAGLCFAACCFFGYPFTGEAVKGRAKVVL